MTSLQAREDAASRGVTSLQARQDAASRGVTSFQAREDFPFYRAPKDQRANAKPVPKHLSEQFVGFYGNFGYGNVTVALDDVTSDVILQFDYYTCAARSILGNNDTFYCEGYGDYWPVDLLLLDFDLDVNPSRFLDIVFFAPWEGKIRFERGLNLEDAPGPRDAWPECEQAFPEAKTKRAEPKA